MHTHPTTHLGKENGPSVSILVRKVIIHSPQADEGLLGVTLRCKQGAAESVQNRPSVVKDRDA